MSKRGIVNDKRMMMLDGKARGQEEDQGDQIQGCSTGGYEVSCCKRRGLRGQGYMES